jgi:hypothetical protein
LLAGLNRTGESENEFKNATVIDQNYAKAHAQLGIVYANQGKISDAIKELEIAQQLFTAQGKTDEAKQVEGVLEILNKK